MVKAVIFDLDNTLYDYDSCNDEAMKNLCQYACKRYEMDEKDFYKAFDTAKKKVKDNLGNTGASHNRMLYMQRFLEIIGVQPLDGALELYDTYWNKMLENMELFPYVRSLFDELKKGGIKIAVLTDLTAHIQHRKLRKLGIDKYVDVIVTSEEAGREKPSIEAFNMIKEKLKIPEEELLIIGDSLEKDIEGAKEAGIKGILFTKKHIDDMKSLVMEYIDEA